MTTDPVPGLSAELAGVVGSAMAEHVVPGACVGVISPADSFVASFGVTSVEDPLPVHDDTVFMIASITKTVTATALMCLVDAGRLELDAPIRTYLPEFRLRDPQAAAALTLRHLLQHAAGFYGDLLPGDDPGDEALAKYVAAVLSDVPQIFPPGAMWGANNADFLLAGRIIEVATGMTYEAATSRLVLEPLGMERTFWYYSDAALYRHAVHHVVTDGRAVPRRPKANVTLRPIAILNRGGSATGALLSTVPDMLRYARFHLGDGTNEDGTRLIRPETLELMRTPDLRGPFDQWRGFPWLITELEGHRLLQYGGGGGQFAFLTLAPRARTAVVTLVNASTGAFVCDAVKEWWLRRFVGIHGSLPLGWTVSGSYVDKTLLEDRKPEELAPYVGRYAAMDTFYEFSLDPAAPGRMLLHRYNPLTTPGGRTEAAFRPQRAHVAFCGEDRFVYVDGTRQGAPGAFIRDGSGEIRYLWIDHGKIFPRA